MIRIDENAVTRIETMHGVDLHHWLANAELPLHPSAVRCMRLAETVLAAHEWPTGARIDLNDDLRRAVEPFRTQPARTRRKGIGAKTRS